MMLLSINNPNYPNWIALIYPNEYKITEKASSFPFLYIYRTFDTISQPFLPDYITKETTRAYSLYSDIVQCHRLLSTKL
jgi:hypothetical protein